MKRLVSTGFRSVISGALAMFPEWLADELRDSDFLCGVDPLFVGLHEFYDTEDGRSYRNTAHVAYPFHQLHRPAAHRATTVALPILEEPWVIVHELGHVLHERLGFPEAPGPVTEYAEANDMEAFAEAFTMAHVPGYVTAEASLERLAEYRRRVPNLAPYFTGVW